MTEEKTQESQVRRDAVSTDAVDQDGDAPSSPSSSANLTGGKQTTPSVESDGETTVTQASSGEVLIPFVEVLPSTEGIDSALPGNVTIDRTQFSVGLSGLSLKRTRMSSANDSDLTQSGPAAVAKGAHSATSPDTTAAADSHAESAMSEEAGGRNVESLQLFTRFLVGAAIYGYDEVLTRLRTYEQEIDENPDHYDLSDHLLKQLGETEDDIDALFRYWAIGMLLWSQRTALQITDRSFRMSLNVGGRALRTVDRTTDNFLLRPFCQPFKRMATSLSEGTKARIAEGRTVERKDRVLAELTMNDIVSDVIDYVSDNPQLAELVSEQGFGLASTIMDNGRQVGAMTDNAVENLVRKIFRRQPRGAIDPSPLIGKPQNMYDPSADVYSVGGESEQHDG